LEWKEESIDDKNISMKGQRDIRLYCVSANNTTRILDGLQDELGPPVAPLRPKRNDSETSTYNYYVVLLLLLA